MKKRESMTDLIEKDYFKDKDLNCSEQIFYAANIAYRLNLPHSALKTAAGFGGGMGIGATCGALTGGILVFSELFIEERARESEVIKALNAEMFETFKARMYSINCDYLKEHHSSPEGTCKPIILEAARVIESILDRELDNP